MKWIYFLIINIIAFSLMGLDKRKAKKKQWRTPESTLFLSAATGEQLELGLACICFIIKLIKEICFRHTVTCCNNGMFIIRCMRNVERNAD